MQAGVAEADAVILRMPLLTLAADDADVQVTIPPHLSGLSLHCLPSRCCSLIEHAFNACDHVLVELAFSEHAVNPAGISRIYTNPAANLQHVV